MPFPPFRSRLAAKETLYAGWLTIGSRALAETMADAGWDAIVVDMQHGTIGYQLMADMVQAIARAGVPALVRVPLDSEGEIGRALDAGAAGIIAPMINTGRDGAWLVQAAKYPPTGARSWAPGPAMAALGLDKQSYLTGANAETLAWAMIETKPAASALDSILSNGGIDGVFVGPNDLSVSLTGSKIVDPAEAKTMELAEKIAQRAKAHKRFAGIYANTPELAVKYAAMGYRFITVGNDRANLVDGAKQALAAARR